MKVRCMVCKNEAKSFCSVKKVGVKINSPRICPKYIFDESKVKEPVKINTTKISYSEIMEAKARAKAEKKALQEALTARPSQGTAKSLGLLPEEESNIIVPGDPNFILPGRNLKNPLTGDLSRFLTTAEQEM